MKDKLYKMMSWPEIEAIVYGDESNPDRILGRHSAGTSTLFQTYIPNAESVSLCISDDKKKREMELADDAGFFAVSVTGKERRDYVYKVKYKNGEEKTIHDPYDYATKLDKTVANEWNKGASYKAYKYMGAHETEINGVKGVMFRVWAPNAIHVSVIGDFNEWNGSAHPMIIDQDTGIFSLFIPELNVGNRYLYEVRAKGDTLINKADPYALLADEEGNSVVAAVSDFSWEDGKFTANRKPDIRNGALTIFEVDTNLWENENSDLFSEKGLKEFSTYVKETGYNYVLLNARSSHMFCMDYYVGSSENIKKLVNELHKAGIGVLYKWNMTSFSPEESGLKVFDGTYLYGHLDDRKRYNQVFGYNFNYGREQVKNLLISSANYLFEELHVDGIHVDDISTVLYLDYGKNDGEWIPNMYGGNENLEAIDFIKNLNLILHKNYPGIITTTKETSMFPKVTYPVKADGLGFDYIWDSGFAEDFLDFIRSGEGDVRKLTDSMAYEYSENYILTISKEDVLAANDYDMERLYDGCGYFDYAAYDDQIKMKLKRATLSFFTAHPGKKLFFMGQDEKNISTELSALYNKLPAFNVMDRDQDGFEWVYSFANGTGVIAFLRKGEVFKDNILVVCNFSEEDYSEFKLGIPFEGKYKAIFCSEEERFGGNVKLSAKAIDTYEGEYDGQESSLILELPKMSVSFYSYNPYSEEEFLKIAKKKADFIRKKLEKEAELKAKELEKEALRKAKEYNSLTKRK